VNIFDWLAIANRSSPVSGAEPAASTQPAAMRTVGDARQHDFRRDADRTSPHDLMRGRLEADADLLSPGGRRVTHFIAMP
jgi:hypothetical protein